MVNGGLQYLVAHPVCCVSFETVVGARTCVRMMHARCSLQINRSSGDLLGATGEDGKVLPELLSDHGGNAVTSTWPKPSARKQVGLQCRHV